jgi:MinD-like ATPase involved in chromosome partitioning or flagellar assembly
MEINTNELMLNAIVKETAAKVVNSLDENVRKQLIVNAIAKILEDIEIKYDVRQMMLNDAKAIAQEYIKLPEVQKQMKQKVIEAANEVMDGLAQAIARGMQNTIKSEYNNWLKED